MAVGARASAIYGSGAARMLALQPQKATMMSCRAQTDDPQSAGNLILYAGASELGAESAEIGTWRARAVLLPLAINDQAIIIIATMTSNRVTTGTVRITFSSALIRASGRCLPIHALPRCVGRIAGSHRRGVLFKAGVGHHRRHLAIQEAEDAVVHAVVGVIETPTAPYLVLRRKAGISLGCEVLGFSS